MGEYVDISTSPADLISIANGLRSQGERLAAAMRASAADIERLEGRAETFPRDDFTNGFLEKYHDLTEQSQGHHVPANEAVRNSAVDMGTKLTKIGDFVAGAMFAYTGADEENATDISNGPGI